MGKHLPPRFEQFRKDLFAAHFVLGEDLGSPAVIDRYATHLGIDVEALDISLADGSALKGVAEAEALGRRYGVQGTPAWLLEQRLISGLLPAPQFESVVKAPNNNWSDDLNRAEKEP